MTYDLRFGRIEQELPSRRPGVMLYKTCVWLGLPWMYRTGWPIGLRDFKPLLDEMTDELWWNVDVAKPWSSHGF